VYLSPPPSPKKPGLLLFEQGKRATIRKSEGKKWRKSRKSARHTLPFLPQAKSRRRFQL